MTVVTPDDKAMMSIAHPTLGKRWKRWFYKVLYYFIRPKFNKDNLESIKTLDKLNKV